MHPTLRTVDFCDTLAAILRAARTEQRKNRFRYGEFYHLNYYKEVKEKGRTYYEVYSLQRTEEVPEDYKEISFVCLRADGAYEAPSTVGIMCRAAKKKVKGLEDFHFHTLRHTYTSNLLSGGAKPKDVQELLGHSDVNTTMNIYAKFFISVSSLSFSRVFRPPTGQSIHSVFILSIV